MQSGLTPTTDSWRLTASTKPCIPGPRLPEEPKSWKHLWRRPRSQQFILAANKEFEHLRSRGTYQLAPRPINKDVLPLVWVFEYNSDDPGDLVKHKA